MLYIVTNIGIGVNPLTDLKTTDNKATFKRSCCSLTNALDIFGDKRTLLIIRDLVLDKMRYPEFVVSPGKIAPNILVDRLERLQAGNIVT